MTDTDDSGGSERSAQRRRWIAILTIALGLLTLVVLRLLLVQLSLGRVLYWEEPYRLVIAKEIVEGPKLPLAEYQADHYQGGSLVVGLLAVPLVAAFGPSVEVLKIVPLVFSLLTALLWCVLLWRAVGPLAAALSVWLTTLAPPIAQTFQVHAMGSHAESALFTVAGFLLVREIAAGATSVALPFLLGLVGGLGLWFCYTAVSGIAAWGLFWLLATPRGAVRRGIAPLASGVGVGLLPWLLYNAAYGFRGLDRLYELLDSSRPAVTGSNEPATTRLAALLAVDLPRSLGFPETVIGVPDAASWIYFSLMAVGILGMFALAGISALRRPRHSGPETSVDDVFVVAFLIAAAFAVHVAAYVVSSFRPDVETGFIAYRFFYPLFPLGAAALAIVFTRPRRWLPRLIATAALLSALGLGLYGTVDLLGEPSPRPVRPLDNGYRLLGLLMHIKHRDHLVHAVDMLDRFSGGDRELAFLGYGWGLQFDYEKFPDWPQFAAGLALCPTAGDRAAALRGASWAMNERLRADRDFANAGFRPEENRRLVAANSELAAHLRALPKD